MEKLFLIDAYALIFRFHYAFINRPMRNSRGENTSAIFGFTKFIRELIEHEQPHHLGVAFDPKGGNFRHQLYPLYKANRDATPEDIINAVPYIKQILTAMRIPILEVPGYEADDVIGTISAKASATGLYDTYMVTPDKDYGQLIRDNVSIYKPRRGGEGIEIVRYDNIREQYCIETPEQIIDILALWGDVSDNIPGVPGIGEKGACKLIGRWGSVENIIANADQLTPKQRDAVINGREQLLLSKQLTTICLDVPIEFEPEKLVMENPDIEELRSIFIDHGFSMFLREMESTRYHTTYTGPELPKSTSEQPIQTRPYSEIKAVQASLFDEPIQQQPVLETIQPPVISQEDEILADSYHTVADTKHSYHTATSEQQIADLIAKLSTAHEFCFDTETTGLDPLNCDLVGLSFAITPFEAYWVPLQHSNRGQILCLFKPIFEDDKIAKIGQNIKFDMLVLKAQGVEVRGRLIDTMILHYLLNPESRHSMDYMARTLLGYSPISIESLIGKGAKQLTMDRVAAHLVAEYAAEDADVTIRLKEVLWPMVCHEGVDKLYNTIEEPLIRVLAEIEFTGVKLDVETLSQSSEALNEQLALLEQQIREVAGVDTLNVNSPKQLGEILFEKLKIVDKPKMTKTKQYKTDEEYLQSLSDRHPVIGKILEYRGIKKLLSTYIEALPGLINPHTGRIHTSFNQAVTSTGRLSSTNPNLQNIPIRDQAGREIRRAFTAPDGGWLIMSADYSQVELRVMAHLSGDQNLRAAFLAGEDVHTATAAKIFGVEAQDVTREQRRRAKTANFGIIYGISVFGLSQRLDIPRAEAKELIDGYFALYPDVKCYMEKTIEQAREDGYVETIFSRRRYLKDIRSANAVTRGLAERNAINAPIQGSAADIIKLAMISTAKALKEGCYRARLVLQVHDELVLEVPQEELEAVRQLVEHCMSDAATLAVPLLVEAGVGKNWLEAH